MESIQSIKGRIKSIEGTRQITRSMRLVSTSKVQRARDAMKRNAPFLEESRRLAALARGCMNGEKHPYIDGRKVGRTLMVVVSGDRGLCGGYNVGVVRHAAAAVKSLGHPADVIAIGSKAKDYFRRRESFSTIRSFTGLSDAPFYSEVAEAAALILERFDQGKADEVLICYTEFKSMLVQTPKIVRILPVEDFGEAANSTAFEPGGEEFLRYATPFYLTSRIYGALLESAACEQSARIVSMDSAVKNADEMIVNLSLRYNQARQSAITQEITEIVGGADAVGLKGNG